MKLTITLQDALHKVNDWLEFCNEFGWSEYAVAEGGGHIEQTLTEEQARRYGLLNVTVSLL